MSEDNGWRVEHVDGRQYEVISHLYYDAKNVLLEALSRSLGKPGGGGDTVVWRQIADVVRPEAPIAADLGPTWAGAPLPFQISIVWHDEYGERLHTIVRVPSPIRPRFRPDLKSPVPPGLMSRAGELAKHPKSPTDVAPRQYAEPVPEVDPRNVFVVVGRNKLANDAMFTFLRALDLNPIQWGAAVKATGVASPYIGQVLDAGFKMAQAVVVLMTPDDLVQLRREYASGDDDPDLQPMGQARPNVLFEAGMALGLNPDRTVLVELGQLRPMSDVMGRHVVRMDGSPEMRNNLANRLLNAGCAVDISGGDWYRAGDFTIPKAPSGRTGRRLPSNTKVRKNHLDAKFVRRGAGSDRIQLINLSTVDLLDLRSPNVKDLPGVVRGFPVARLPAGKSVTLMTMLAAGRPDTFDLVVNCRTEDDGEEIIETLFLDLNG
ncbi:TIR domain-containing protein [Mycobacteroides abscessus]